MFYIRVNPGLKSTVYCMGVASGGEEEWNFVYKRYKTATVAAEKSRLLSALSCTNEKWILNRLVRKETIDFLLTDISFTHFRKSHI